jgi:dTDP-4-amino-4,6-dideoxygalactose transaminase
MDPFNEPVRVTRPDLPSLDDYAEGLKSLWDSGWIANRGPVHQRFEARLGEVLQTNNLSLFSSGALALEIGLAGLQLTGEVITTPFTFVATANAVARLGLRPVFADIEPERLTLDPEKVEAAITPKTSAILAVHMFGAPCQLEALAEIAQRRGLALIYDAALAFGVTVGGRSIAAFGDMTMFSLHATKPFHTVEGGVLTFARPELKARLDAVANHGLDADGEVETYGVNAKMSEFHALMGDLLLRRFAETARHGREIEAVYRSRLGDAPGLRFLAEPAAGVASNHGFAPILIDAVAFGLSRDALQDALKTYNVMTRRYFVPLVSDLRAFAGFRGGDPLGRARQTAQQILSLPTYRELALEDVHRICDIVLHIHRENRPG